MDRDFTRPATLSAEAARKDLGFSVAGSCGFVRSPGLYSGEFAAVLDRLLATWYFLFTAALLSDLDPPDSTESEERRCFNLRRLLLT